MILVHEVDGLFILRRGHEGVGVWNSRQDPEEGEKWNMDPVADSTFTVGHVTGGTYLDLEEDVVPLLRRVQTVHVEDVTLKMGLAEAEVPWQALAVEEASYQKDQCGPPVLEKLMMGHGEGEALAKTLLTHLDLVEGEALLRAAQL